MTECCVMGLEVAKAIVARSEDANEDGGDVDKY